MGKLVHTYPPKDLIEHVLVDDLCICGPEVKLLQSEEGPDGWHYTHWALDVAVETSSDPKAWDNYVQPRGGRVA